MWETILSLLGSILPSATGGMIGALTGRHLTGAQKEANQFSAAQAQLARDWSEKMYNQYESPRAMIDQYKEAGLNPALMYGGTIGGSVSSPAGSPESVNPGSPDIAGLIELAMQGKMLKAEIDNIESQTDKNRAETARTEALTPVEVRELASRIDLNKADMSRAEAETSVAWANAAILESDAKFRDKFNEVNLALAELDKAKSEVAIKEANQRVYNLMRDYVISFAKEQEILANTGKISAEALNASVEYDILQFNKVSGEYEAKMSEYNYDHRNGTRIWNRIATGASALRDAGVAVGSVAAGLGKGAAEGGIQTLTDTFRGSKSRQIYNAKGKLVGSFTETQSNTQTRQR